ncbi:hypothetical protein J3R30DRAFT_3424878 [Lentinula aciculospora]|uniref:Uncharacterized protein n=1 Tax=Lentinula aciculospora TaxID=153920 RepID=A0A9W9AX34_9AGAR|nr:hypothetical protein J3R30DRAFT_3424878 [Lentinula aciculospora]
MHITPTYLQLCIGIASCYTSVFAQTLSIPTSWRKPSIATSLSDRVQTAAAAIENVMSMSNTSQGLFSVLANVSFGTSATFYWQLAEFDLVTNGSTYEDAVANYFPLAEASRPGLLDQL